MSRERIVVSFIGILTDRLSLPVIAAGLISLLLPVTVVGQVAYRITDLGTLGGNNSIPFWITNSGDVVGVSDTGRFDGFGAPIDHAFVWRNGSMRDLGTLGGNNSGAGAANDEGEIVGISDVTEGTASHTTLWDKGAIIDLDTLNGPDVQSVPNSINNRGQIVGLTFRADGTLHGVLWQDRKMIDLGTLGGPSSVALGINDNGQIIGISEYNDVPDPIFGFPLYNPVIWYKGVITDLGSGPNGGIGGDGFDINNRGQAVGRTAIRDPAEGAVAHAFLWESGVTRDLGVPDGLGDDNSEALSLNNNGEIVGDSGVGFIETYSSDHALLWQDGAWADLNTLIPANSGYQLIIAPSINARGQIVVWAVQLSTGNIHAALLTPQQTEEQRIGAAESPKVASSVRASASTPSPGTPMVSDGARRLMELARRAKFSH
jgi:probable HAF family extracellular repeat protein